MHVIPDSSLTCPNCGYSEILTMPTDSCLYFHQCMQCKKLIKAEAGDVVYFVHMDRSRTLLYKNLTKMTHVAR